MMSLKERADDVAMAKVDVEKLVRVVNEAVAAIALSTSLPTQEVLEILESIHVEMVSELKPKLMTLEPKPGRVVDAAKLSHAIEKAIAAISWATDLHTDEITTIFSEQPGASVEDVASRLHEQSRVDRADYA